MKIHYNNLSARDFYNAAQKAGVDFERFDDKGSKSHKSAYDVILSGSSNRRPNSGKYGASDSFAATWDEWGVFLAELYFKDPSVKAGDAYMNQDHFNWSTGYRYTEAFTEHKNHKWFSNGESVTGSYYVSYCDCGASRRFANKDYVLENFVNVSV